MRHLRMKSGDMDLERLLNTLGPLGDAVRQRLSAPVPDADD
jgi:hypothetical protein